MAMTQRDGDRELAITLNIDFTDPAEGPGARGAVELTAASARELGSAIEEALQSAPPELLV